MLVEQIMIADVSACLAGDTLQAATQQLATRSCGALPVVEGPERVLVGIVTDRDISLAALRTDHPLSRLRVADAMTSDPRTCRPDDSLFTIERAMREVRARRLPVVDGERRLLGIVSVADLALQVLLHGCVLESWAALETVVLTCHYQPLLVDAHSL